MKNKNEPVPFCLIVKSRSTTVKMPCKNLTWRKKARGVTTSNTIRTELEENKS